jgi:hypothetical protein
LKPRHLYETRTEEIRACDITRDSQNCLERRAFLLAGYFCSTRGFQNKSYNSLLFSAVVFLPLFADTNHNDVGSDAHFM